MSKLFKKYPEGTLVALAVAFSAFVLWYFVSGVTSAAHGIVDVFNINKSATENAGFDLPAAAKLDLRGLVQ